jgi:hypothetical protein
MARVLDTNAKLMKRVKLDFSHFNTRLRVTIRLYEEAEGWRGGIVS